MHFDGLLFTFAVVSRISSFDGLTKTAFDEFPLQVEFDLLKFVHKMFAIKTLPGNRHKNYQRFYLLYQLYSQKAQPHLRVHAFQFVKEFQARESIIITSTKMTANYDWIKLNTPEDYKFFACIVAEKLRNNNFKSSWREAFLKTFLEEIKPSCSFKAYQKIQKLLNEVANQKYQEEKEQEQRAKQESGVKTKNLAKLKQEKAPKNYNYDDEESFSDDDDGEF